MTSHIFGESKHYTHTIWGKTAFQCSAQVDLLTETRLRTPHEKTDADQQAGPQKLAPTGHRVRDDTPHSYPQL
jgi:hypothetical protein